MLNVITALLQNKFLIARYMHRQNVLLVLIITGLVASLFINLNVVELRAEEPRRAVVAMEMYLKGDYIVPHLNGWEYYNKPPLFNWILIGSFRLFGSFDEWVVRMPSIVAFLAMGMLTFAIVKHYINRQIAILSSLFFLTSGDLLFYGTATGGEIDIFYSLLVMLQVSALFHFYQKSNYALMFVLSYFFAALGVLTKGLPSIVFQALTLLPFLWEQKRLKLLFSWQHFAGPGLFLAITGSYFYAYSLRANVEHFAINLVKEASKKSGLEADPLSTVKKTFLFPLDLVKYLLPWSLLVVFLFSKEQFKQLRLNNFTRFSILFILFNIPVYWVTGESRSRYIYAFFPFICTILAYAYYQAKQAMPVTNRVINTILPVILVLLCLAFAAIPFVPQTAGDGQIVISSIALAAVMLLVLYGYKKWRDSRLYLIILAIVVARIGMALIYFPLYQATSTSVVYREHATNILRITGDNPVYFYGTHYEFPTSLALGPAVLLKANIITPPYLPYQLPYYITKANNHILEFTEKAETGKFYLAYEQSLAGQNVDILYRFNDKFLKSYMVLMRIKN